MEQTRVIFRKIERLLKAAGGGMEHIVQTTDYITTTENYRRTADVRREFFKRPYPTATGVIVHGRLRPRRRDRDLGRGGAARLKLPT